MSSGQGRPGQYRSEDPAKGGSWNTTDDKGLNPRRSHRTGRNRDVVHTWERNGGKWNKKEDPWTAGPGAELSFLRDSGLASP